ncbi:MAG: zinc-binding dehydrogenase [Microthrixaceae bacterium]
MLGGLDRQLRAKMLSAFVGQRLTTFVAAEDHSHLERLADLVERGQVRPVVDRRYRLEDTAEAIRRLESGRARGKVVLEVGTGGRRSAAAARSGSSRR